MTVSALPFERSFQRWIEGHGMGWSEVGGAGGSFTGCRSFCLSPASTPRRGVLALHGAGNDALFAWVGLFKELLLDGALVYSFDLPGHGRGGTSRLDLPAARESIEAALGECLRLTGNAPIHAIGVSLGGSLLLNALPLIGERLTSAALVVAPLRIQLSIRSLVPELTHRTLRLLWREREHYGLSGLIPSFGRFKREVYPLRLAAQPPPGMFGYVDGLNSILDEMALEESAARTRLPVLLCYGNKDRIVPLEQAERLAHALPDSRLLRIEGGTHLSTPLSPLVRRTILQWMKEWE